MSSSVDKVIANLDSNYSYWDFYRDIYRQVACGPSLGILFEEGWLYNDELPRKRPRQQPAFGISVSSIVEGSETEVEAIELRGDFTVDDFWAAVGQVDQLADWLWQEANQAYIDKYGVEDPNDDR